MSIESTSVVYPCVKMGSNVIIKHYSIIGGTGYQYERDSEGKMRYVEHEGGVILNDNVTIGSFCTVVRALQRGIDTIIGEGTKIDDHVHVGHNLTIGKHCGFSAGCVLGGTVQIGDYTFCGINTMIKPKVKVGDHCLIGMGSVVIRDVPPYTIVCGNPAKILRENKFWMNKK